MKKLMCFCSMLLIMVSGLILSSCCTPNECTVNVNFINAHEDMSLKNYSYKVDFDSSSSVTFKIPEGFDHTELKCTVKDVVQPYTVEFDEEIEPEYQYTIGKTITINFEHIKRTFKLNIDFSNIPKKQFDIRLDSYMLDPCFRLVSVEKEKLINLRRLLKKDVLRIIDFNKVEISKNYWNEATVDYGEYLFLVFDGNYTNQINYNEIYSDDNRFTEEKNIATKGTIKYSYYPLLKKGNSKYLFNGNSYSNMYYLGRVKESMNFYRKIPNYESQKGFKIEEKPNVFQLFTGLKSQNSDLCNLSVYSTEIIEGTKTMTLNDGTKLYPLDSAETYNSRYDVYNMYIGEDLSKDKFVKNEDLYLKVEVTSEELESINNLKIRLLHYEYERYENCYIIHDKKQNKNSLKLSLLSDSFKKDHIIYMNSKTCLIKLSREILENIDKISNNKFILNRDRIEENNSVNKYKIGSAVLDIEIDRDFIEKDRTSGKNKLACVELETKLMHNEDSLVLPDDFYVEAFLKVNNEEKYGFKYNRRDYYMNTNNSTIDKYYPKDSIYFKQSELFANNSDKMTNFYIRVYRKGIEDFRTVKINSIIINYNDEGGKPVNIKEIEKGINFNFDEKFTNNYQILIGIDLKGEISTKSSIDFSNIHFPMGSAFYTTNSIDFKDYSDFDSVFEGNKTIFSEAKAGFNYDLFYFAKAEYGVDFDFDIYWDIDGKHKISHSKTLTDMIGNPIKIVVGGEPYIVKALMLDKIFEYSNEDNKIYALSKK